MDTLRTHTRSSNHLNDKEIEEESIKEAVKRSLAHAQSLCGQNVAGVATACARGTLQEKFKLNNFSREFFLILGTPEKKNH